MKSLTLVSALFVSLCFSPVSAHADNDDILCDAYGKIGGFFAATMLPITVQELVDMMTGKNPELTKKISIGLLSDLSGRELMVLSESEDIELLSMSAGQTAIQLLMGGQTSNKPETIEYMHNHCVSIGPQSVIENQRIAKSATDANMQK